MSNVPYLNNDQYHLPMRGIGGAKTTVANYLSSQLPITNAMLRQQWNLAAPSGGANLLPDPDFVYDYEQGTLNASNLKTGPSASALVFVSGTNTVRVDEVNISPNVDPYYDVTYQLAAVTWVKTHQPWENLIYTRDNFATAVRFCLMLDFSLGTSDGNGGWTHKLDVNSIREGFPYPDPSVAEVRGDRNIAGATISFQVVVRETPAAIPEGYGPVKSIADTVTLLHPAFQ